MPENSLQLPRDVGKWRDFYHRHLVDFILPFWEKHGIDERHGGLMTCLDDEGNILSTDKYLWSQTRGLWTYSALYRRIEKRAAWLDMAHDLFHFCRRHGMDEDYCWRFRTSRTGERIDGPLSIVTDLFAIYGMVEYARITDDHEAKQIARRTYESVVRRLESGTFGTAPYPLPQGMKGHRYSMQCSLMFHELGDFLKDEEIREEGWRHTRQILEHYVRPEHHALVEYTNLDGSFSDTPAGRAMVPGHGIESIWFQLQIFRESGRELHLPLALEAMEWCLQRGWDAEHGGLLLGLDIFGKEPVFWKHATTKPWWPVSEALCGTLLAHERQPNERWLAHHRKVMDWALEHYPVPTHGEWRQRLDQRGTPFQEVIALPVKDPFHLPRGLIVAIEALDRMKQNHLLP